MLDGFLTDGCDLIVTGSDVLQPVTTEYARANLGTKFVTLAGTDELDNLGGAYVRVYQAYYLAGIVAASQPGVRNLGYVGSMYAPDSIRNVNAFFLGAQSVNKSKKVYVMHTGSWFDTRMERIAGTRLFHHYDVDVLTYDSDSTEMVKLGKPMAAIR